MADPFTVTASVLGILSSLMTISQPVVKIVDDIRKAPSEIRYLSTDIHTFYSVIRTLDINLHEQDFRNIVEDDEALLDQIRSLKESLRNCRDLVTSLMVKHAEFERKGDSRAFRKLRWAIFTKSEVRSLQLALETMKSTLSSASSAVLIVVSLRGPATGGSSATVTRRLEEQTLNSVTSLVDQTCRSVMSGDPDLCQQVVRIYRRLDERREQMQQLRNAIGQTEQSSHDSSTVDVFLNFASRFSVNGPRSFVDRLRGEISGKPDYLFETSGDFCPEQYDTAFPDKMMSISAILPLPSHPRTQRYFVTFQEKARRWQRVVVVAGFENIGDPSAILQVSAGGNIRRAHKDIPERLRSPIQGLLQDVENFGCVTDVFANFKEDENGQISAEMIRAEETKNMLERHMSDEKKVFQDIQHLECPQFQESQVIFKAKISSYLFKVWVGDRDFTERKVPFASAGLQGDNLFDDFIDEVRRLRYLRGCRGISQFLGLVLDDTRRHIKGYLYEAPAVYNLRVLINLANSQSRQIPWDVRESWVREIVAAMSNVHDKGLVIGALNNNAIHLREDGTIVLDLSECALRNLSTKRDRLPPELWRMNLETCRKPSSSPLNYQTDVYQLGFSIWLIAEHRSVSWGYYCTRAACTNVPRYQCTASHTRPTELPPCSVGIPSYIDDLITASRLPDPKDRRPAWWLKALFPPRDLGSQKAIQDGFMKDVLKNYPSASAGFGIYCTECGESATYDHYHCYICYSDDFDLCSRCYAQGIRCWNPKHQMVKRTLKGDDFVEID